MKKTVFLSLVILLTSILTSFKPIIKIKNSDYTQIISELYTNNNHPLYISVCQIEHNIGTKTTEIAVKVFADDLEKAVSGANNGLPLHLNTKQEIKNSDDLVRTYLLKSLKIKLNNKVVLLKWVGKEYEKDDATWCYFEAVKQKPIKTVWVQNSIFTEIYSKQNNIVQVKTPKGKKSLSLSRDEDEGILSF
jgi:hypothetical protein